MGTGKAICNSVIPGKVYAGKTKEGARKESLRMVVKIIANPKYGSASTPAHHKYIVDYICIGGFYHAKKSYMGISAFLQWADREIDYNDYQI